MEEKVRWISRSDYVKPWIQAAKSRDIKLSNKNLKRLNDCHGTWASKNFGINGLFRHCYEEHIEVLVQRENPLLKLFGKTEFEGRNWIGPVILIDKNPKE